MAKRNTILCLEGGINREELAKIESDIEVMLTECKPIAEEKEERAKARITAYATDRRVTYYNLVYMVTMSCVGVYNFRVEGSGKHRRLVLKE